MQVPRIDRFGETRRQWLASIGRWCALTALAVLTGRLLLRPRHSADCGRQLPCQNCGLLDRCGLPRAAASRREETGSL